MSFSSLSFGLSLFFINSVKGSDCNGCADMYGNCVELVDDMIYGCYGTFTSPESGASLCGSGYHMCESANEAEVLGLNDWTCGNSVPSGNYFWSLETSQSMTNNGECYSEYGDLSNNNDPIYSIWGCTANDLNINICGNQHHRSCGPFNKQCDSINLQGTYGYSSEQGIELCESCNGNEIDTMKVTDSTRGGVICCSDTIPNDLSSSGCDESITIYDLHTSYPDENLSPFIGKYTYSGNNADGYPMYIHHQSGAQITISTFMTADLVLRLEIPNFGPYFSSAISFETGVVTDAGNNRFEIIEDFWSPPGTDIDGDNIPFVRRGVSTLYITATFSDCPNYGLENVPNPANTTPQPQSCPNYDNTVQANCNSNDFNCGDCQEWGCAQCDYGYYKMGNLQKCQSCSMNYPNCQQCGDWNGCILCNYGYSLQWDATCQDEICVMSN